MSLVLQDLRVAVRMLRRTPSFTIAAIILLAIGIAATTAIFSTVNAALLRPLPYPRWQDLRTIRTIFTDGRETSGLVAPVEITGLNDADSKVPVVGAAFWMRFDYTLLTGNDTPVPASVAAVSERFFPLFGMANALGPGFAAANYQPGGPAVAVISHQLWQNFFAQDPIIVGKNLRFSEGTFQIVGVAAADMNVPEGTDVWFPLEDAPESTAHLYEGYMRVRPGVDEELLRSSLVRLADRLGRDFGRAQVNRAFVVQPLVHAMVGDLRPILIIVLSATILLFALTLANVLNLLLARGAGRMREMAVRSALGAARSHLVRQLLTESLVLAGAGAVAGTFLGYVALRLLLFYGASTLPRLEATSYGGPVFLLTAVLLIVTTVLVAIVSSFQAGRRNTEALVRESGRTVRGSRATQALLKGMIVAEIGVAVTLVCGAGWLVRSFTNLQNADDGFTDSGRLVFNLSLPFVRYQDVAKRSTWTHTMLDRIRAIPGVVAAGSSSSFPTRPDTDQTPLVGLIASTRAPGVARRRTVSPGFFESMGARIVSGRDFTDDDRQATVPVAIVNQAFARRYLQSIDPLGTQIAWGFPTVNPKTQRVIVGVVSDIKYASVWKEPEPAFYLVPDQIGNLTGAHAISVVASTKSTANSSLAANIRAVLKQMDPLLTVDVRRVEDLVDATRTRQKLGMTLMLTFGIIALTLAAIGVYGVIAYAWAERGEEMATRLALGATSSNVLWLLARQGALLAAGGMAVGLAGAYASGRLVSGWLYEVRASDPFVIVLALALVCAVTIVAILVPARRMGRIDPATALRGG